MKKVMFVLPSFHRGGAEKTITTLIRELQKEYNVTLVVIRNEITLNFPEEISVKRLSSDLIDRLPLLMRKMIFTHRLSKTIREIQPDIIFSSLPFSNKIVARAGRQNIDTYYIVHNTLSKYLSEKKLSRLRGIKKLQKLYKDKNIIAISEGVKDDLLDVLKVRPLSVQVIYNPFDVNEIEKKSEVPVTLPGKPYIVSVGHFYSRKRHDVLLKAFAKVKSDIQLVLLGSRGDEEKIRRLAADLGIEERVLFAGWHDNPYPWIKHARMLILSSDQEGLGRVLVESLILGTPVISTDCPSGPREILREGLERFLVPVGDDTLLAERIDEVLERYPTIDEKNLQRFDSRFSAGQYKKLIEKKKAVFILPLYRNGGAEKTVKTLAEGIAETGCEVSLLILKDDVSLALPHGVQSTVIGMHIAAWTPKIIQKFILAKRLKQKVRQINPDLVFSSLPFAHNITTKANLGLEDVFYIFHITPSSYFAPHGWRRRRDSNKIKKMYDGKNIVAISEGVKEDLLGVIGVRPKTIKVIYNPFDRGKIAEMALAKSSAESYSPFILHVGNFNPVKRHDVLIDAYRRAQIPHKLLLVGEGKQRGALERLVAEYGLQERILFLGWVDNPYPFIKNAELLVLSSDSEGLPRVLVESLILGTPAVSTDCKSGARDVLHGTLRQFLSPIGDAQGLAETMQKALKGYPEISAAYTDMFDKKNVIKQYIGLLDR